MFHTRASTKIVRDGAALRASCFASTKWAIVRFMVAAGRGPLAQQTVDDASNCEPRVTDFAGNKDGLHRGLVQLGWDCSDKHGASAAC